MLLKRTFKKSLIYLQHSKTVAQLAGRKHLPGSHDENFPRILEDPRPGFPHVVTASDLAVTQGFTPQQCANAILPSFQQDLLKYGAVLYRNFPINDHESLSTFFHGIPSYRSADYKGGQAPRSVVGKDVYTASNEPPHYCVELHNEMAYHPGMPHLVLFYCAMPASPGCGGESVISDVRRTMAELDPAVVRSFERLGVKYHFHVANKAHLGPDDYDHSWQSSFHTCDRGEVESNLRRNQTEFQWNEDGSLNYWRMLPAIMSHPLTGERLWCNHIFKKHASGWFIHPSFQGKSLPYDKYPTHSYYGNGEEIEDDVIQHLRNVIWKCAVGFQMQKKDLLFMDNLQVAHARLSFTGQRKLYAILAHLNNN